MKRLEYVLLFLTLLFLPTQLGRHFWPQFAYVYSLPIDYLSPTIYFWDLLIIILLTVFVAQQKSVKKMALIFFLLFILSQTVSLVGGDETQIGPGLVRLEQYLIAGLFGVYLASINLNQVRSIIFWSLGLSIIGESALATLQFLKGETLGLWILGERSFSLSTPGIAKFDFGGLQFLRPYGTFSHPNVLAAFMVITIPLLHLFRLDYPLMKILSIVSGGITVILTVSRASLVAGLFEAVVLLRKRILIWLLLVFILVSPFLYTRFSTIFNFDNLTLLRREQLSEVALNLWLGHPLLGVGLNNFIPVASDQLLAGPSRFLQPVHNIFLLDLAEAGIIGLVGLMILIGWPIFQLYKLRTINHKLSTLLLVWGVIIFLGLFDHYFLTLPQGYRLLFVLWGLSMSMIKS